MSADLERRWWIDGGSGAAESYAELIDRINRQPPTLAGYLQPGTAREALRAIAAAIAHETTLTLIDADMGHDEKAALGLDPTTVAQVTRAPGAAVTLAELQRKAAGASRACFGLFTSGSTGLPKQVRQSAANLARNVKVSSRHAEAVWAFTYSPTHIAGLQVALQAWANGCALIDVRNLSGLALVRAIEDHGVTHLSATPSFYRLLAGDVTMDGVRSVTLGGESADARLLERIARIFPRARVHNLYASTEAGTLLVAEGELFTLAAGLEDRIRVEEGTLRVHRRLLGEFDGAAMGEWYDTGDTVEVQSRDPLRFRIVARQRDWINIGGSKVNPREVEARLDEHPGVFRSRVFGRRNSVMGQILCAEIVPRGAAPSELELREFAGAQLQPFKVPRIIRVVDRIEMTRSGKLART